MSNLDKSRRLGVPKDPQHSHPPPPVSTLNIDQSSTIVGEQKNNGLHSNVEYLSQQQHHHNPTSTPCHVPQHLHLDSHQESQLSNPPGNELPQYLFPSGKDLDGELSGLQAAAAKTALVIPVKSTGSSLNGGKEVVTIEDDDDDGIFRKHVGFSTSEPKSIPQRPTQRHEGDMNGHITDNGDTNGHPQSATLKSNLQPATKAGHVVEISTASPEDLRSEKKDLLQQLNALRRQRHNLQHNALPVLHQYSNEWDFRLSTAQKSHRHAESTLQSVAAKRIWMQEEYSTAIKWHVLGDVFFIWHRGPFGTINGCRLGKSTLTMLGLIKKCAGGSGSGGSGSSGGGGQVGSGGGASIFSWGATSEHSNGTAASHSTQSTVNANNGIKATNPRDATQEKITLPWTEINSALGQVVFLLYTLQNTPYSGISFRKHILQPCGTASKIGVLKKSVYSNSATASTSAQHPRNERRRITALAAYYNTGTSADTTSKATAQRASSPASKSSQTFSVPTPLPGEVTWYNLHHYEENGSLLSMGYYARRNFNTALEALLYCIAEACSMVERRDMALAAPYIMRVGGLVVGKDVHGDNNSNEGGIDGGGRDGEATVGGLTLAYDPAAGERWTMVCKYMLTNLKWLVAYAAKHVDR